MQHSKRKGPESHQAPLADVEMLIYSFIYCICKDIKLKCYYLMLKDGPFWRALKPFYRSFHSHQTPFCQTYSQNTGAAGPPPPPSVSSCYCVGSAACFSKLGPPTVKYFNAARFETIFSVPLKRNATLFSVLYTWSHVMLIQEITGLLWVWKFGSIFPNVTQQARLWGVCRISTYIYLYIANSALFLPGAALLLQHQQHQRQQPWRPVASLLFPSKGQSWVL